VVWAASRADDPPAVAAARSHLTQETEDEYRRLLYVAMTRAADRLYICGYKGPREVPANCWYRLVQEALDKNAIDASEKAAPELIPLRMPFTLGKELVGDSAMSGEMIRLENHDLWRPSQQETATQQKLESLPGWARALPLPEPVPPRPLAPSRSEGDIVAEAAEPAALSPLEPDGAARFHRGLIIHRLLQLLPELPLAQRPAAAARLLARPAHNLDAAQQQAWAAETLAVLDHPAFAPLFGPGSRAEVPLSGTITGRSGPYVVSGQIDRLLVAPDRVLVIDYKTNRPPPQNLEAVPALYLRQMAAYRALLREIWPDRPVEGALLWTDGPRLMALPEDLLDRHKP
jgi:ATP-dependent helicase/nuclease subunit A